MTDTSSSPTATPTAPPRHDTTPLTLDEEKLAADLLESVPPPSCDWQQVPGDRCGVPATMLFVISCGHTFAYCSEHADLLDRHLDRRPLECSGPGHKARLRVTYQWRKIDV